MVMSIGGNEPAIDISLYIAPTAAIIGDVRMEDATSVWFGAVIRGDMASVRIGSGTNIQDGAVLHVDTGFPLAVGKYVTVGHSAILHGCTIGDEVLVGMGSRILNGAEIGRHSIVAAGALVPPGKSFPERSLLVGMPARVIREVEQEEIDHIKENAEHYISAAKKYAAASG